MDTARALPCMNGLGAAVDLRQTGTRAVVWARTRAMDPGLKWPLVPNSSCAKKDLLSHPETFGQVLGTLVRR